MLFAGRSFSSFFEKQETSGRRNQNKLKIAFHRNDFLGSEACTHKDPLRKGSYSDAFTVMSHYTIKQTNKHLSLSNFCCMGQTYFPFLFSSKKNLRSFQTTLTLHNTMLFALSVCLYAYSFQTLRALGLVVDENWMHLILVPTTMFHLLLLAYDDPILRSECRG